MAENALHSIAFPTLGADRLAALGRCSLTARKAYPDGEALFRAGDRDGKFFVVKVAPDASVPKVQDRTSGFGAVLIEQLAASGPPSDHV